MAQHDCCAIVRANNPGDHLELHSSQMPMYDSVNAQSVQNCTLLKFWGSGAVLKRVAQTAGAAPPQEQQATGVRVGRLALLQLSSVRYEAQYIRANSRICAKVLSCEKYGDHFRPPDFFAYSRRSDGRPLLIAARTLAIR